MADQTSRRTYRWRLWERARADRREFARQKGLATSAASGSIGAALAVYTGWRMSGSGFSVGVALIAGLIGAVGGPAIVYIISLPFFRLRAPFQLDQERKADQDAERLAGQNAVAVANDWATALEKQLDKMKVVQATISEATAELRSAIDSEKDVLILSLKLTLRNEAEASRRAFFPAFELLGKNDSGEWEVIHIDYRSTLAGRGAPRGMNGFGDFWHQNRRLELPELDEMVVNFFTLGTNPAGAVAFLNRDLKLRLTIDVPGQPNIVTETGFRRITSAH